MDGMSVEVCKRLDSVTETQWEALYPNAVDRREYLWLSAGCGMDGFSFGSVVVRQGTLPILLLPLFQTRFDLSELAGERLQRLLTPIAKALPGVFRPRLLGVGMVEGEWSDVGVLPGLGGTTLQEAWQLAGEAIRAEARSSGSRMIIALNLPAALASRLEACGLGEFTPIESYACAMLPITFRDLDGYLATLSKSMRKDLRAKLRDAADVEIQRTADLGSRLEEVYHLYRQTVADSDISFGVQTQEFLGRVGEVVPGAQHVLYLKDGELIAWNLLVEGRGSLVDKYFAMHKPLGRQYSLYFVSWLRNIEYCIERGIPLYHAGPAAEQTKARLGCRFIPCQTLFRHRNVLVHGVLKTLRPLIGFCPQGSDGLKVYAPAENAISSTVKPQPLRPVLLDLDGSIRSQTLLRQRGQTTLDLHDMRDDLRLSADVRSIGRLRDRLEEARRQVSDPWLTFVGSGDYHHLTLSLLQTLAPSRLFTLVVIDNHPDWFSERPLHHCGNWVSGVWELPHLEQVILIGQDSDDFRPYRFIAAPFRQLCEGTLRLYPLRRRSMDAWACWSRSKPMPANFRRCWWGTRMSFETIRESGPTGLFRKIATTLAGRDIYLSIDKDCLSPADSVSDWEQGGIQLDELVQLVGELKARCRVIGADVCGERAPTPLKGLWKRWDAGRRDAAGVDHGLANLLNEHANLAILNALSAQEVVLA